MNHLDNIIKALKAEGEALDNLQKSVDRLVAFYEGGEDAEKSCYRPDCLCDKCEKDYREAQSYDYEAT